MKAAGKTSNIFF